MENLGSFAAHVKFLLKETILAPGEKIGILSGDINLKEPKSGGINIGENPPPNDQFLLSIPYGGTTLIWEVIFQANTKEYPPDFIFNDSSFKPDVNNIKSFGTWDVSNKNAFLNIVKEFISEYKEEQFSKLAHNLPLYTEVATLLEYPEINQSDLEIYTYNKFRDNRTNILIKLPIDFSSIPPVYKKENTGECTAVLVMYFSEETRRTPDLLLSPAADEILSLWETKMLKIPNMPPDYSLIDYVLIVITFIREKVELIGEIFSKRSEYITSLLTLYNSNVLEYDGEFYKHISLLLEWNEFHFVVLISLESNFPEDGPLLTFSSIYHKTYNGKKVKPYSKDFDDCPFSPRWAPIEMAKRTWKYIIENVLTFKKESIQFSRND